MTGLNINNSKAVSLGRTQVEGLKGRPDLEKGLPFTGAAIEGKLTLVSKYAEAIERLKKAITTARLALRKADFDVRESARANIAVAGTIVGRYSKDLAVLGGKPLGEHRSAKSDKASTGTSASPAPAKPDAS